MWVSTCDPRVITTRGRGQFRVQGSRSVTVLYSYLYDLGFRDIDAKIAHDHVIFGELQEKDAFNWLKKLEAARKSGFTFDEYAGGYDEFAADFLSFFADPRRFTYSPVIVCCGVKPR